MPRSRLRLFLFFLIPPVTFFQFKHITGKRIYKHTINRHMYKFNTLMICCILIFFGCEQQLNEPIEPALNFEIQTSSSISSVQDCYSEMLTQVGENFTGTSCSICSNYSANPGESVTAYGVAYFNDANIKTLDNLDYNIIWTVVEGDATFTTSDDPRKIQIELPESFDRVVLKLENLAPNGLAVSEFLIIRNARGAIEIGDPGQAGLVIYDKGQQSENWQFMETTQFFIGSNFSEDRFDLTWGLTNQETGIIGTAIGEGKSNTATLVNFLIENDDLNTDYKTLSTWAIHEHSKNGFSDWYLPSLEEAKILVENHGSLSEDPNGISTLPIWTSTEADADHAFAVDLYTGEVSVEAKNKKLKTIGIRYF